MMKTLILLVPVLSACASLPQEKVQVGDPVRMVTRFYGTPTYDVPSVKLRGARAFYYLNEGVTCSFQIKNEIVTWVGPCLPWTKQEREFLNRLAKSEILPRYQDLAR